MAQANPETGTGEEIESRDDDITSGFSLECFSGSRHRLVQVAVAGAVLLLLGIGSSLAGVFFIMQGTQKVQFSNDIFWARDPTLPVTYNSTQESHDGDVMSENIIIIGEEGSKHGHKHRNDRGVVVSEDNEIFVSDLDKKRIDVYSMNGTHLRHFLTELPGGNGQKMLPYDVAMDGQGHLWVPVLKRYRDSDGYVVQYSQDGQPLSKFAFQSFSSGYPHIDFDVRTNNIILVNDSQIVMFHPNGTMCRTFGNEGGQKMRLQYAASDKDGNIFVTELLDSVVQVYHPSGHRLFGGYGSGEGKLDFPRGIRVDTAGHVFVANEGSGRVDVFTSRGEFLLTAAEITKPWNLAVGPTGQLVVTKAVDNTITIFPGYFNGSKI
ncbi:PREDICTED: RING finger protein nhl-1-like [Branchiostoma belcheri]|uniref:RING finger protein nhl-1-like n=1 Tax=Branchiostoma belcheri TaxID=7741 RepID=A0A6P4Y3A2_BRABE|nr:PREDICTED: RING finger protein nhl-1-like [Branchiostoma belcheri]